VAHVTESSSIGVDISSVHHCTGTRLLEATCSSYCHDSPQEGVHAARHTRCISGSKREQADSCGHLVCLLTVSNGYSTSLHANPAAVPAMKSFRGLNGCLSGTIAWLDVMVMIARVVTQSPLATPRESRVGEVAWLRLCHGSRMVLNRQAVLVGDWTGKGDKVGQDRKENRTEGLCRGAGRRYCTGNAQAPRCRSSS